MPHEPTPDEIEQRQRADGSVEDDAPRRNDAGEPLDPDVIEQRQRADGTYEDPTSFDDPSDEPLDPDAIEQRREVGDPDDEDDYRDE